MKTGCGQKRTFRLPVSNRSGLFNFAPLHKYPEERQEQSRKSVSSILLMVKEDFLGMMLNVFGLLMYLFISLNGLVERCAVSFREVV